MHLFLVRHGETVDNVAGLYAGSRDSALTAHGVLQVRRLATHLAAGDGDAASVTVRHIFSSNLRRAVDTAEAIREAQKRAGLELAVVQLAELREKDFGSGEGVKYGTGARVAHEGAETAEAMKKRVDRFLDDHLLPVLDGSESKDDACVVVAHGIILSVLWKVLCARFPATAVSVASEAQGAGGLQPAWSNTGYLCAVLARRADAVTVEEEGSSLSASFSQWKLHVKAVNATHHLKGLKKTRGGIGSAKFDTKQKTMDSFFKPASRKRKAEDEAER